MLKNNRKGCKIKVEYSQEYEIESKLLELRIYPAHDKLHEILEKTLLDNGYIIKEIFLLKVYLGIQERLLKMNFLQSLLDGLYLYFNKV